jgi:NADH:ubiquinone oxidoreductase subunit 5 (subunit L)/multisubunit Na+/H+ antiporter MnhA subunit/multisubunit Na+/H+ antiporter MnhB subunit
MPGSNLTLLWIVFTPFAAAAAALWAGRVTGRQTGLLMVLAAGASFAGCLALALAGTGEPAAFARPWIPGLGIAFSFRGDAFGLFFALLISGIGTLVGIYSLSYIPALAPARLGRYYAALCAFMGAMLGVALSDDLILLFIFWEVTSITSFLLIGFWYEEEHARHGALTALLVTALGGLTMMVGFIMVGLAAGTFSLAALTGTPELVARVAASPMAVPALLCILAGAMTKSAQWPFHFWLPGAMVAPTPVSTYLHAATMVKAGIFLLGRLVPVFGASMVWSGVLVPIGLATFLLGAVQALFDTDLKGILARTTVATLGLVTMLYGLGASAQDALQIFSHATYKGGLFLVAGVVEHAVHVRDIRQLGGLRRRMPVSFVLCLLGALSMAGLPPFFGFLAKEGLYAALLAGTPLESWMPPAAVLALAVLANAFLFAVGCRLVSGIFLGPESEKAKHAHEGGPGLLLPAAVLTGGALLLGLAAPLTGELVSRFSSDPRADVHLSLLPTHLGPLVLTLATVGLGALLFAARGALEAGLRGVQGLPTAQRVWDAGLDAVTRAAVGYSRRWQNGSLRWYLAGSLVFAVVLAGAALRRAGLTVLQVPISLQEMTWYGLTLCVMLGITAVTVARATTRLGAAIALTANGFLTALLFVVYRSPDILLTQILIETVATIFLLLILYYLPPFRPDGMTAFRRLVNLGVAVLVGFAMFTFVLLSTSPQFREVHNLAGDYLTRSLAQAGGANAVNVIIVDFRAIDTNGEITVLVLVGLVVFGLLRARRPTA